jgi:uncharacterized SAM-binding protein YcdF (DUF218 family)
VRRASILLAFLVIVWLAWSAVLFIWPRENKPGKASAVIVLSGARDTRLAEGLELMRAGAAPTLIISDGRAKGWAQANRLCKGKAKFAVVCFRPKPYSTQGEAETFGRLAKRRGWGSVVVVTSRYHVTRSRILFRRCTDAAVRGVAAETSAWALARNLPFEWGKLLVQLTLDRKC